MEDEKISEQNYLPHLGDRAPAFVARTTMGKINFPDDFAGSWVILFSHPADFTPVCTTEFMTFASMQEKFEEANCKLVGLSVDGIFSHIAWLRNIKEKVKYKGIENIDIRFPIIEDVSMKVSSLYGMIQPNEDSTKAVRAVFFIDPRGKIRAMIYYPLFLGRNLDEIYRALIGMKTAFEFKASTPANWEPGDDLALSPPSTYDSAEARLQQSENGIHCEDWFLCFKSISKEEVMNAILKPKKEAVHK